MDGSEGGDAAMGFAFGQARLRGTSVLAVHAWHAFTPDPAMRMPGARVDWSELEPETAGELDRQLRRWQQACPDVRVDHVVVRGRAKPIMLEAARRGQLLVLGRRGRGGFPGMLLGSVVRAAIHHAVCPVAVVGTRELGRAPQPSPEDPGAAAAQDGAGG